MSAHSIPFPAFLVVFALSSLFLLESPASGQTLNAKETAQSKPSSAADANVLKSEEVKDNSYFTYRVTGDEQMDLRLYAEAKEAFVAAYPERYAQMVRESAPKGKIKMSREEFEILPDSKKSQVLNRSDLFEISE
jgi:hypothetical protein